MEIGVEGCGVTDWAPRQPNTKNHEASNEERANNVANVTASTINDFQKTEKW
jgi:hypothetical protein